MSESTATTAVIGPATVADLPAILDLLRRSNLPIEGVAEHIDATLVAREGSEVVANATLELYDSSALLRSVAVDEHLRGTGLGHAITRAALDLARQHGVTNVYLLTETAADFFPRFGFHPVDRDTIPSAVRGSIEFTTLCPSSSLAMGLRLAGSGLQTRAARPSDAEAIARIYNQGIEDRVATFETRLRTLEDIQAWFDGVHPVVVVEADDSVIAFASTSTYRPRECYVGIAEFSVYVAREARGRGAGRRAMEALLNASAEAGLWKLLSRIFVENTHSRALMSSLGFREVGIYEKHARLDGHWRDVVIVERLLPENIT
jgi:L-amino acid N-acyltransferase YncA